MRRRLLLNFGGINCWQGVASGRNPDWLIAQRAGPSTPDFNLQRLRERWRGIGAAFGEVRTLLSPDSYRARSCSSRLPHRFVMCCPTRHDTSVKSDSLAA